MFTSQIVLPISIFCRNINLSETEDDDDSSTMALVQTESELNSEISSRNLFDMKPLSPPTTCRKSYNDYTPPPKRYFQLNIHSICSRDDYVLAPDCGPLIDASEHECTLQGDITICDMENEEQEAEGVAVSFFGFVHIHVGKKERKRAHARLKNMHLSFHEDDEVILFPLYKEMTLQTEEYLCGPYQLTGCRLISRTADTISIRLNELESQKHVIFNVEDGRDNWSLVLSEACL